jgi:glycosyltransferase involved in cell wall biosynthesis
MKIVYLHQYFNTRSHTGGTRSFELARRLVAMGHEVHMVTSDRGGGAAAGRWRQTVEEGIQVHWFPVPYDNAMGFTQRLKAFFSFAWHAGRKAASLKGNVVFATSTPLTIALPGILAKTLHRVPMVFEVRDLWPELPIAVGELRGGFKIWAARRLERFAYRHSSRIVALSPGMRDGVVACGYDASKVEVIPNLSEPSLFRVPAERGAAWRQRHPWLGERPLVIYAGTFGKINGVGYLAEVAAEAGKLAPEIRFAVIGKGREEAAIRERARELGVLDQNFWILPPVAKEEMPDVYSAASVCTSLFLDIPAMRHNSANKVFDAFAAGKPLAINYLGWHADLIGETGSGVLMPPGDAPEAARRLVAFLQDPAAIQRAALASAANAEAFTADRAAEKLEQILKQAVAAS